MIENPTHAAPSAALIDAAPLLAALWEVGRLPSGPELEVDTDAQSEALAVLWALATGEAGAIRRLATEALRRVGIEPGAPVPCAQPIDTVGACISAGVAGAGCARCEFNPATADAERR